MSCSSYFIFYKWCVTKVAHCFGKTYTVGTHWNSLIERQFQCVPTIYIAENKEIIFKFTLSIMSIVFTSFEHLKLQISIITPVTIPLTMTAISPNLIS